MRHQNDCQCDVCIVDDYTRTILIEEAKKAIKEREEKLQKSHELMRVLNIKTYTAASIDSVSVIDLYDILMNEEKLRELVSKLKMKAFW